MARRIYDTAPYRRVRAYLQRLHRAGAAVCVRCGQPISPLEPMDVGHVDGDPTTIAGPEHARCNRATARHKAQRRRPRSRVW